MTQTTNSKPAETIRDGAIKATIWRNQSRNEGANGPFYSVRFTRTYTDEQGQFHDSDSFSGTELLRVARLADIAYGTIVAMRAEDKLEHAS
ncbi:MAG: hypothetical protein AAFX79_13605 [Planctomycetota bacterium]